MTRALAVGFANIGRGTPEQTRVAIQRISDKMVGYVQAALLLNEVDEADQADEHGLLSTAFRVWQDHAWHSREPILTKGLYTRREHSFPAAPGVPHQTPARQIHEVIIDGGADPDIVLIGGHYPAGAHNGHRSPVVYALLMAGYARMQFVHRSRIHHHHRVGRHVVWAMDVNWRAHFPRLHRAEGTLAEHGPDLIRVAPASGWAAHRIHWGSVPLPVEQLHRLEWAVVEFRPITTKEIPK